MSKKLYSTPKWKNRIARAQERELENTRRKNSPSQRRLKGYYRPKPKRKTVTLVLPNSFSIIDNPEETIAFLEEYERQGARNNIRLDLDGVSHLTIDAVTALGAHVQRLQNYNTYTSGTLPKDLTCLTILVQSGFFEHVRHRQPLPVADRGKMAHQQSKRVEVKLAQQLIHRVTQALFGKSKPCQPAYRAMIECMSNTYDHAARSRLESEKWWATAFADTRRKFACFTFLDTGVGIFKSVKLGTIKSAYRLAGKLLGINDDSDILRDILQGKVESSTGLRYRGKGLPSMHDALVAGRLQSLVVVSNSVYANVKLGDFRTLNHQFRGTLLYWEV